MTQGHALANDKLEAMYAMQQELNEHIGRRFGTEQSEEDRIAAVLALCRAAQHEIVEIEDWLPWKWWYTEPVEACWMGVREEIVDLVHFVLCLALVAGMSPDDLYQAYCSKNIVNHERQAHGYARSLPEGSDAT